MRPLVRRYRYLVESVPPAGAALAHVRALDALDRPARDAVLHHVRTELLTATRVDADDTVALARYLVAAEHRRPGALADGLSDPVLVGVVDELERSAGPETVAGYRSWIPVEPAPPETTPPHHPRDAWDRLEDDAVYAFMMDSQRAPAGQPPKVRR